MKNLWCVFAVFILACSDQEPGIDDNFPGPSLVYVSTHDTVTIIQNWPNNILLLANFDLSGFDSVSLNFVATDLWKEPGEASIASGFIYTGSHYMNLINDTLTSTQSIHSGIAKKSQLTVPSDVDFWIGVPKGIIHFSEIVIKGWRE